MSAPSLAMLTLAELSKVFSRSSARVGLAASAGLGLLMPLVLFWLLHSGMEINGVGAQDYFDSTATRPLVWSLHVRNFLIIRVFLVVLGAQSLAGELGAHTLREDLLRPVPRGAVLGAKWLAIVGWDGVALAVLFAAAAVPSLLLFGASGPWLAIALAFALNALCDAALVAGVLAIAALTRSTVATLGGVLVALVLDWMAGSAMYVGSQAARAFEASPAVVTLLDLWPALPSHALGVWAAVLPGAELQWISVGSLAVLGLGSLAVAQIRLARLDVP